MGGIAIFQDGQDAFCLLRKSEGLHSGLIGQGRESKTNPGFFVYQDEGDNWKHKLKFVLIW